MIRRQLILATSVLVVLTCLSAAFAQGDSVLQRYDLAIENLQVATASVPQDGAQARDELERALNALLTLSRDATSTSLVQAMERTFERTRVAVDNQSRTDMAVQTAVLAGGFSRLVMDSAYLAASSGDLETARGRLQHLGQRLSFAADDQAALEAATSGAGLRLAFEAGASDAIAAELANANDLATIDSDAAYVSLARAYGESLLIQDSPRVDASLNRNLVGAVQALVTGDETALASTSQGAQTTLANLASAARSGAEGTPVAATLSSPAPDELPSVSEAATPSSETSPVAEAAANEPTTTTAAETPASAEAAAAAAAAAPTTASAAVFDEAALEAAVAARVLELTEEAKQTKLAGLTQELTTSGLAPQLAGTTAARLVARGYDGLSGIFEQLEAAAGRVAASVSRGDDSGARSALAQLSATYQQDVAPVLDQLDPNLGQSTSDFLTSLAGRQRLTQADASILAARTAVVRDAFAGEAPSVADNVDATVAQYWSGMPSSAVFLILGILAIFPLVLLNMAFGGSNHNWRLVGWALFLLLVPVFFEAILGLVDLLGSAVDMSWFPDLTRWSMFGSLTGQVVWALLVLVAVILAIVGLRGICVQFGLLGGSKKASSTKTTAVAPKGSTGHTTIDWDEEF